ncbi:hypothetical protein GE061_008735 [Apolygus lucorum]|uniref:Uncharacterized protein n=1 Tax=Apolygus lucorum TaxID=248454 RepID=A0A8S9WNG7_APOLU|nr:hypothetical protein GE061_008735 [Apolygus lucorum]
MEDGIVVKEEPMSEGDEDQVIGELVLIKQEVLTGDEYVEEEVGNSTTVKDEDAGCPMIKQEDSSAADPLCDESDVLQGSIGVQRSEAGPAQVSCEVMEDGIVVKEEPMSEGDEDQEMEVEIKQEVLIGDEYVKEEVGNSRTDEDEDAGCPMIKQEDSSAADPLCDESDVLQGSIGVQRSEAGPAQVSCEVMEDGIVVKEEPMSEGDEDQEMEVEIKQEVLIGDEYVKEEVGNSRTDEDEDAGCPMIKQEDSSAADPLCDESDVLQGSIGVQRSEAGPS